MLTADEIITKVTPIFKEYGVKRAILYDNSIDKTSFRDNNIGLYIESNVRGFMFFGLLDEVSKALGLYVDVIDKRLIDPCSGLQQKIIETGKEFII